MTISRKLFEIFKKNKQHIVPVFIAITVPFLEQLQHVSTVLTIKKNSKKSQFFFNVSLCYHTQKKACFKIHFLS